MWLDLDDAARGRSVPVAEYPGSGPAILFSVGYGGGRDGYAYLARHWAGLGYRVLVVEHVGSNLEALQRLKAGPGLVRQAELAARVTRAVADPRALEERRQDLRFVTEQLGISCPYGLAGHSYGSATVLAAAGLEIRGGGREPAPLKPAGLLAMSPSPPGLLTGYARPLPPTLMLTGTRDDFGATPAERIRAFEALGADTPAALAVVEGADHMGLAGIGLNLEPVLKAVQAVTARFWGQVFAGEPLRNPRAQGVEWRCER